MGSSSLTEALRETLALFDNGVPQTTSEVAERLDLGRRSTYERLQRLVEHDQLETKEVGANGRVWWRSTTDTADHSHSTRDRSATVESDIDDFTGRGQQGDQRMFELLVDAVEEYAIFLLDLDGSVRTWNRGAERIKGYDTGEILGEHFSTFYTEEDRAADVPEQNLARAANHGSIEEEGWRVRADGSRFWANVTITPIYDDGALMGYAKVTRDMTDRRERERQLRTFRKAVDAAGHSIYYTDTDGTIEYVNPAFEETTGYTAEETIDQTPRLLKSGEHDQDFYEDLWDTVLAGDIWRNELVNTTKGGDQYVVDQTIAPVEGDSGEIEHLVAINAEITDRVEAERNLQRRHTELATLNHVSAIVHEVTDTLIDQSTREEIERTVCDALADADSYECAWIGGADTSSETVTVRTSAGETETPLGNPPFADPGDERSDGPTARAFRTGTIQVMDGIDTDPPQGSRHDDVDAPGVRAVAAIPLVNDGMVHGVLTVSTDRPSAFTRHERAVLGQLGEIIGQAIAATERKQALMSDEIVEVEFRVRNVFDSVGIDAPAEGRITFDDVVATSDGAYLVFGTMSSDARETLDALVDQHPDNWGSMTVISEEDDHSRFQVRLTELPFHSGVISEGGYIEEVLLVDGDLQLRVHLPPSRDVSAITEAVERTYPTAQLLTKSQFPRPRHSVTEIQQSLSEGLTDRQQAALGAAYHRGYFEWPRDATGEEIADSLGIAAPTFHQHLRRAEKAVFETVFSSATPV